MTKISLNCTKDFEFIHIENNKYTLEFWVN